jgi:hypothetical protein
MKTTKTVMAVAAFALAISMAHAQCADDLEKYAIMTGDTEASMFGTKSSPGGKRSPNDRLVVNAIINCAIGFRYKDAASISLFIRIAQAEMRRETAELEKVR